MLNLTSSRKAAGKTQQDVADYLGISRQAYSNYENGKREPDYETLLKLGEYFGKSLDYLLGRESDETTKPGKNWIPVKGVVRAGIPIDAVEDIIDWEELPTHMAQSGQFLGLRVIGDSMEPRFHEGDTVIVRIQPDLESGEIGVVMINGDTATIKKVIKSNDGIMLMASNPRYEPRYFSNSDINTIPVRILGKVVELRAKF